MANWKNMEDVSAAESQKPSCSWKEMRKAPADDKDAFDFTPYIGRRNMRANINAGRIHLFNFYCRKFGMKGLVNKQQEMIDSGELTPRINPENDHEELLNKLAIIGVYVETMYVTRGSRNKLVVEMNTPNQQVLEQVGAALWAFGINMKYELAQKDELKTPENEILWNMVDWVEENRRV